MKIARFQSGRKLAVVSVTRLLTAIDDLPPPIRIISRT